MATRTPTKPLFTDGIIWIPEITGVFYTVDGIPTTGAFTVLTGVTVKAHLADSTADEFTDGSAISWTFQPVAQPSEALLTTDTLDDQAADVAADEESALNDQIEEEAQEEIALAVDAIAVTIATAIGTADKTAAVVPATGKIYALTFTNGNSASSPTLNLGSNGAKAFQRVGTDVTSLTIAAGGVVLVYFTGTKYIILG